MAKGDIVLIRFPFIPRKRLSSNQIYLDRQLMLPDSAGEKN